MEQSEKGEVGDGSHHDEGCSHGREGGYDHSSHDTPRHVDSLHQDGKVEVNESGSDRGAEAMALSVEVSSRIFVLARAVNMTKFVVDRGHGAKKSLGEGE